MELRRVLACLSIIGLLGAAQGCIVEEGDSDDDGDSGGGDRSCSELCSEAQAGDCTTIVGNCDAFCGALASGAPKAGCESQRQAYQSCFQGHDHVCEASCNGPETDLENCLVPYCATHQGDGDCTVLIASF